MLEFEAVVLACGVGEKLLPLSANGGLDFMLPVGLKPLISYPLQSLQQAGAAKVVVVVSGDHAAATLKSWMASGEAPMQFQTVNVPEGSGSADALRAAISHLTLDLVVVMGYNLVMDVPLRATLLSHYVNSATASVMFTRRKTSASSQTKPGKVPENVDYVALDEEKHRLLFYAGNPTKIKELQIPGSVLSSNPSLCLTTNFQDTQLYIFSRAVLTLVEVNRRWSNIQQDLIPYLMKQQFRRPLTESLNVEGRTVTEESDPVGSTDGGGTMLGLDMMRMGGFNVASFMVGQKEYCSRITSMQEFADVNKELASPELCRNLVGLPPSRNDDYVHDSVVQGNKSTIATACIVWEGTVLGDKTNVKRAVIGSRCRLGNGVKVINSVVLDDVIIGDNAHIQNSVVGPGCTIGAKVQLKECQVGPDFTIAEGSQIKGEVLPEPAD
ncbi:hypothetical protein BSKO_01281 [Bryopsis sp. KO-2023]|nr:hypothetical protein BSKO_01281 [Bryopsis sp. KO-2023]